MQRGVQAVYEASDAGLTVLAPNTELAAAVFDAVDRRHVATGHGVWPTPHIRDFGSWLKDKYAERQLADSSLPRVLSDIEERELWRAVILDTESARDFLEPAGAARSAARARHALSEYGIAVRKLVDYATEESTALLNWNRRFGERCQDLHCIAPDQLLEHIRIDARCVVWLESPLWRPVARRWLEHQGAAMLLPADMAAPATCHRLQAASPEAELAAIADWARRNLRSNVEFRAWICIPDLNLRRAEILDAFDAALAPQRFWPAARDSAPPYALAGGTPLSHGAPVRAALTMLSASLSRISFEHFSALLRMPELQPSSADAGAAAMLDLELRTRGPSEATLSDWLRLAEHLVHEARSGPVVSIERLRVFQRTMEGVRGHHPLSRWVSIWVDAFESGPWSERNRWSSTEFQSAERFRELVASLATGDHLFGERSAESAGRLLQRAARDTPFQVQTGVPPIWVSGQIMDPWLTYDGLWIAGCSEERWPPTLDPIALLPVRLQREYGVVSASADSQRRLAEDLQHRWRVRARSSVFSCADRDDGTASALSPLLRTLPPTSLGVAAASPHWRALAQRAPVLERLMDEEGPAFASQERTRGVATLRAQSQCAFRGFATRLRGEALDRPTPGFNPRERGEMLHRALEQIWSALGTWRELTAIASAQRDELIHAGVASAIDKQCERRDPGERWRRRENPRLSLLLNQWLDTEILREPFEVEGLESGAQSAYHGGLEFKVRIDRIDRLVDGGRVLIDYKTGRVAADWRGDRPDNPQLPIYALLRPDALVAVAYGKVNASECGFITETERGGLFKPKGRPTLLEGMPDFSALVALWSQRIEKIAGEFAAGRAEVAPTVRACATCRLQPLCRIPSALDEREISDD